MFATMAVASDGRLTGEKDLNLGASQHASATLPQHPGEDAFQHIGEEYKRVAESRLAGAMLLATANGGSSPFADMIKDVPPLPLHPVGHADYDRRIEARYHTMNLNAANAEKRFIINMMAWTKVYEAVYASVVKTAPMLAKDMHSRCDLSKRGVAGAYFDGPLAWAIATEAFVGSGVVERTKADKLYYKTADDLQLAHRLPDGCAAD